jgi:hypothetical protein
MYWLLRQLVGIFGVAFDTVLVSAVKPQITDAAATSEPAAEAAPATESTQLYEKESPAAKRQVVRYAQT